MRSSCWISFDILMSLKIYTRGSLDQVNPVGRGLLLQGAFVEPGWRHP